MKRAVLVIACIVSSFVGGAVAQTVGGGVSQAAQVFANMIFGPIATNVSPTFPGGPLGSNVAAITNGTLNIWNSQLYGWGGSATAFCVLANSVYPGAVWQQSGQCPITGTAGANYNAFAAYVQRDMVGFAVRVGASPPLFGSLTGTFTATTFVPTTPLNANQIANLRLGMPIDTNDATPFSGIVTGWAANGSSVTVQAWYSQQSPFNAGTPAGTAATIQKNTKVYGGNIVAGRAATSDASQSTALELDCNNNSGVDDTGTLEPGPVTAADGCLDAVNVGVNIASFGVITRGLFNAGIALNHTGLYGLDASTMTVTAGGAPIVASLLTPTTSGQTCKAGSIQWDTGFIYVCTAANTWKRATLTAF